MELDVRTARITVRALHQSLERRCDEFVDRRRLPLKAYLRVTAAGKRPRFQPQYGWFIIVAPLDTDSVLTPRAVEYPIELAAR